MNLWEEDDTFLSRWLNDDVTPEEKAAFEASAEGRDYIVMMKAAEQFSAPTYDVKGKLAKLKTRIETTPKPVVTVFWRRPTFRYAVAASIALIAVVALLLQSKLTRVSTSFGEQEIALLPDGSEIKINSSSSISYDPDTWEEERTVKLSGEAFFNVKKGSDFVVKTIGGEVKVLGTSFNVKSRKSSLEVVCFTGKVNVSAANISRDLTPGMALRINDGAIERSWIKTLEDSNPSWVNGITKLEDVPFQEALDELQHIFGISVDYNKNLDSLIYNGAFPNDDAESAIKLILEPLDIRYTYESNTGNLVIQGLNR